MKCITGLVSRWNAELLSKADLSIVYIASPFWLQPCMHVSDEDVHRVSNERRNRAIELESKLVDAGAMCYNPLRYEPEMGVILSWGADQSYWSDHALRILSRCDGIILFKQDGHDHSWRTRAEVKLAELLSIPLRELSHDYDYAEFVAVAEWARDLRSSKMPQPPRFLTQ